jgi:hypothetical protein
MKKFLLAKQDKKSKTIIKEIGSLKQQQQQITDNYDNDALLREKGKEIKKIHLNQNVLVLIGKSLKSTLYVCSISFSLCCTTRPSGVQEQL